MTIGGFLCIRDGIRLAYCYTEAIKSLLPICQQVVVSDCESSDGTREDLDNWAKVERKLKIVSHPWTDPKGDTSWYPTWLNAAREHLETTHAVYLDADEVLDPKSYPRVVQAAENSEALICYRLNYWSDPWHLIPKGVCCGTDVIRVGPQRCFFPSDYPDPRAEEISRMARPAPEVIFHHVGFLRPREQFFLKAKAVQRIWANSYDPRLDAADKAGGNWMLHPGVTGWENNLVEYNGDHPEIIKPWLKACGYANI